MEHIKDHRLWILALVLILVLGEAIWSFLNDRKVYQLKDTAANIIILIGFQISKIVFVGYQIFILNFISGQALFNFKANSFTFFITFILADFIYYWFHRISHSWKPLWAFHLIHHSSVYMNLTTSYRLNWFSALISPVFFAPLAILGLPIDFIIVSYTLNLFYQFFLHTESIGKLGVLEGIIDTPSAHRVHHGSNEGYIDKNFGGVFMIWDKIFKTYEPEKEKVIYGLTSGESSYNPFKLMFKGFIDLFKKDMGYKG
ncbi:MAG: sterol desaturase family protein [Sphingobacteriales bacterium]|nr:sterol desaturase family protein [Sphingobacteriales bacterium]